MMIGVFGSAFARPSAVSSGRAAGSSTATKITSGCVWIASDTASVP